MENEILQLAALVAAFVGVTKGFGLTERWTHVAALLFAALFVLVPAAARETITMISIVGLTASGAYQYVKKREDTSK